MLAVSIDYSNPLLWAVLVGWIISVILHEFAHGIVAHWGGDYTIRERGGLTLNPLQYIDPVMSLILPAVFLILGGIPLPGGSTYVRRDLLRNRFWQVAVSLAGPGMNFLLFLICAAPLHPAIGWVDGSADPGDWTPFQVFIGAQAVLQFIAMLFNLLPVPPLDGFQAVSPFLPDPTREFLQSLGISLGLFLACFMVLSNVDGLIDHIFDLIIRVLTPLGFDFYSIHVMGESYNLALFGAHN